MAEFYRRLCPTDWLNGFNPEKEISASICEICGYDSPSVMHLVDNASNPASMRYLFSRTQPPLRYWGYDNSVSAYNVDFIRSHSVYGLINENLFSTRLTQCAEGKLNFDLPPLIIFDQKILLCLPFLDETREKFDEEIRSILAYTYPVTDSGFRDMDGEWVSIEKFLSRPGSGRRYYIKYGGSDTNINWGSRGVFRLDTNRAEEFLLRAVLDYKAGRPWLIQSEIRHKTNVQYFDREAGLIEAARVTPKYSCFYGPRGLIGMRAMYGRNNKVHGSSKTIVSLIMPSI